LSVIADFYFLIQSILKKDVGVYKWQNLSFKKADRSALL
jgi:hypothetical protein